MISLSTPARRRPFRRLPTLLLGLLLLAAVPAASSLPAAAAQDAASAGEEAAAEDPYFDAEDDALFEDEALFEDDPLFDDDFGLDDEAIDTGFPDPFESPNRAMLRFNTWVDRFLLDPVTRIYRFLLPEVPRRAVIRFFDNLNSPQIFANDVFQLEWKDAGITLSRLLVNSTVGIGGLFDPATRFGLEHHKSDFGQTLALAGAPSGPYFVIPFLGPTTVRGGVGLGVDALFHPTFYVLGPVDMLFFGGTAGLSTRARHFEELQALKESSIDFYAALRSGYFQTRQDEIWSRREDRRPEGAR